MSTTSNTNNATDNLTSNTTNNTATGKGNRLFAILLFVIPMAFYLFFWAFDGVAWCADSDSYVIMHECREPLYPSFLSLLRGIFGVTDTENAWNNTYLSVAVLIQSILAAISTWSLARFLYRKCDLGKITATAVMAIPLGVSILNRFVAARGAMYSNSILTEGIAISLYLLFVRFCMGYITDGRKYDYSMALIITILGILTRKQMYVMLILLVGSVIYRQLISDKTASSKRIIKALGFSVLTAAIALGVTYTADNIYNGLTRGNYHTHTEDNRFLTTMALYTAKREYVEYIPEEYRDVFLEVYDICDENEWTYEHAPSGFAAAQDHFSGNYDHIQLDTLELVLMDHADDWDFGNVLYTERFDIVRDSFNKSLLPHEIPALMHVVFNNMLDGLLNTVAKNSRILYLYTVVIYILYILLTVYVCMRRRSLATGADVVSKCAVFSFIALIFNLLIVSAVIFAQTRYMIYNMPVFYMMLIIMISKVFESRKNTQTEKENANGVMS